MSTASTPETLPTISRHVSNIFAPLQHQIDRVFDEFTAGFDGLTRFASPKMDVAETDKEIEMSVELPGMNRSDVKIAINDGVLTVSGEKKFEKEDKARNYRLLERTYGAFSRSLQLPKGAKADDVQAVMADGVLKITVAKPPASKTKTIEIKQA